MICHGAVRTRSEERPVFVLAQTDYVETIRHMYRDTDAITVVPIRDDSDGQARCKFWREHGMEVLKMGYLDGDPEFKDTEYDKHFYRQAGVPFENRWSKFKVTDPETMICRPREQVYTVTHDDHRFPLPWHDVSKTGLYHHTIIRVKPSVCPNVFGWLHLLRGAHEIHVIPSSVYLLIDSLPDFPSNIPLYLYKSARPNVTYPEHRKNWIIV